MDLTSLRDSLANSRVEIRRVFNEASRSSDPNPQWAQLTTERQAVASDAVSKIRDLLMPNELQGTDVGILSRTDASYAELTAFAFRISAVAKDIQSTAEEGYLNAVDDIRVITDGLSDTFQKFLDDWRTGLVSADATRDEELQQTKLEAEQARALAESAQEQLAAATADANTPEPTVSSPFSVKDILDQISPMDAETARTINRILNDEQQRIRDGIDFSHPEVRYSVEEWRHKLDAYVDARLVMQRDGYLL